MTDVTGLTDALPTLQSLLTRVAGGDRRAMGALYEELGGPVYWLAQRLVRDPAQAEQVVRDVFVEIWRQAPDRQPCEDSVRPWVASLVRRSCVDVLRARVSGLP